MSPLLSIWVLTPRVPFDENNKIIILHSIFMVNQKRKSVVSKMVLVLQDKKQTKVPGLHRLPQWIKGRLHLLGGGVEILVHATYGPYSKNGTANFLVLLLECRPWPKIVGVGEVERW